jgi:hypothetical protein
VGRVRVIFYATVRNQEFGTFHGVESVTRSTSGKLADIT